ncbi:hypothetical protein HMPREF1624_04909 [Sporothrix schenckii ATCC 58251]|uniref:Azaphilone pigments biosynthesis cluster protein L N-terminal domain-containing protein n=1 Tax=Sporothrix schenckii (strain ATCC 58251 / de Perez 2211183) TaxID=1391915 RepID=U7PTP9_SPOS1|nr:hypothetical protein HMPREF1624_04909 [Sporothrix schenckii ATCC 58251]
MADPLSISSGIVAQVAAITPQVLEDYKDLISDANEDLGERLQKLEKAIQDLSRQGVQGSSQTSHEWQAMLDEKKYTQQGLRMAAQLSAQIQTLEAVPDEPPHLSDKPSAHKFIKSGLDATKGSISTLVSQLRSHESKIEEQMAAMMSEASAAPLPSDTLTELSRLRETKDSIHQCINIVSSAGNASITERRNIFEDITLADNAYNYAVSTVGDLVTARRINLSGRSRNIGGQISDESFQMSIQKLTTLDMKHTQLQDSEQEVPAPQPNKRDDKGSVFDYRFGRGVTLAGSPSK